MKKITLFLSFLFITCYSHAQIPANFLSGDYSMQDVTATLGPNNGSPNFENRTVTITIGSQPYLRVFTTTAFPGLSGGNTVTVELDLRNNNIVLNDVNTNFSCDSGVTDIIFGAASNNTSYNLETGEDEMLTINYTEDVLSSCSGGPQQSSFSLQKLDNFVTLIPDDDFERALRSLNIDDVIDGSVLNSNIENVTSLDVSFDNISDLTGIEGFTSLQILRADFNSITQVDLTSNSQLRVLDLSVNSLFDLDLSQNSQLLELNVEANFLRSLDLRNGNNRAFVPNGTSFRASSNNLTCISVSDVAYMTSNFSSNIDSFTSFNADCTTASVENTAYNIEFDIVKNPVDYEIEIVAPETIEFESFNIYNLSGKIVKSGIISSSDKIDVSEIISGVYILQMTTSTDQNVSKKFIKK